MAKLSRLLGVVFAGATRRRAWKRYGVAILLPVLALALTSSFSRLSVAPFFTLFSLSVVVAAMFGGIRPGLVAVACSLLVNLVALPPAWSLRIADPEHLIRLAAFGLVASVIAVLIGTAGEIQHRLDVERRRLDVTLRCIGDAVIATDTLGQVTFMNEVAEKTTGYTQEEARGRFLHEIFHIVNERTRARVENPVRRVLATGRVVGLANHTVLIRKEGSEIPIDDSAAPIVNQGVLSGVILVFRDITESKLSEAALLRAEKLASVGRLAATIAHEINNPLESVMNLLYLIAHSEDVAAAKQLAESAQAELARAAHVSKQTLSFARPSGIRESADLPSLVDSIIALYESRLRSKNIALVRRYRGDGIALASRDEVRQVVSNLLGNAIDAESRDGCIEIRISTNSSNNSVRLTVADHGCGMSDKEQQRLFEPFFTTKQEVGTGLGLWMTKQIVDTHGGTIRVRSRVGRGTVFVVSWPVHDAAKVNEAVAASDR